LSKIRILSEHLANKIAAGEVVERPASVVKELLENSIDAGASRVQIEVEGNGTRLIRVIDDGAGMDSDDVLLCLERHATSKLREDTDEGGRLDAIRSLGFRGEAIPSIASVAKMTITSRTEKDPLGSRVEIQYGKIIKIHETGCNKGTVIEVRNLFGNVPARKKFLKSARTELFHIEETVRNYSLANNRIGISYTVDSKPVYDFPAETDTLRERVNRLYSRNITAPLIHVRENPPTHGTGSKSITVEGFLLSPENSFATSSRLRLFVNGRAVRDRMMAHGVAEGLSGYLMKGRSAAGVLFVILPHDAVDVNVHPAKQEIRFRQPSSIHSVIVEAVRSAMARYQEESKDFIFGRNKKPLDREPAQPATSRTGMTRSTDAYSLWDRSGVPPAGKVNEKPAPSFSTEQGRSLSSQPENEKNISTAEPASQYGRTANDVEAPPESLKPIGQLMDLYLLCEAQREDKTYLVVIDQHAVHERILFENLKKQFYADQMPSQSLLFPKMLELTPESVEILTKHSDQIRQFGIVVEEFGGDHYVIKAVPSAISHLDPEEILNGVLSSFSINNYDSGGTRKQADATRFDDILSSMACKAAVKAGQDLSIEEIKQLLKLMAESSAFTHCPHGRPVIRMFSDAEIKKWFHRT
jgi:DNA mismatch repair protein MutL